MATVGTETLHNQLVAGVGRKHFEKRKKEKTINFLHNDWGKIGEPTSQCNLPTLATRLGKFLFWQGLDGGVACDSCCLFQPFTLGIFLERWLFVFSTLLDILIRAARSRVLVGCWRSVEKHSHRQRLKVGLDFTRLNLAPHSSIRDFSHTVWRKLGGKKKKGGACTGYRRSPPG